MNVFFDFFSSIFQKLKVFFQKLKVFFKNQKYLSPRGSVLKKKFLSILSQWTIEPNRKYRNFGVSVISVRFVSVRWDWKKPNRNKLQNLGLKSKQWDRKLKKSLVQNLFHWVFYEFFLCEIEQKWLFIINFAKNGWKFPKINVF